MGRSNQEPGAPGTSSVELVRRAQAGDPAAFEHLLDRFYPRVLELVRRSLGPKLREHVESTDVVQETMIEVVRGFDRFDLRDDGALIRWLARVVQNRVLDAAKFHRAAKRDAGPAPGLRVEGASTELGRVGEPAAATADAPARRAEEAELVQLVLDGLDRLDGPRAEVIRRRMAGETWAAIAAALGLAGESGARALHDRALLGLMKGLATEPRSEA